MKSAAPSRRTQLKRRPQRSAYDQETIRAILDEGLVCHVGFIVDGYPTVLPMAYARVADTLYLHGASKNAMLGALSGGRTACVTVTLLDGIVCARSAFHHSMNYRSVVVFGAPRIVTDRAEKETASAALVEHVLAGRSRTARGPDEAELSQTQFLALLIDEASAKVRRGAPVDDPGDMALDVWAGVVPLALTAGTPVDDPAMQGSRPPPPEAVRYRRGAG